MERSRPTTMRAVGVLVVAAGGMVLNLVGATLLGRAVPYLGFPSLARAALPGLMLAVAAGIVALTSRGGVVGPALAVGSVGSAGPALGIGLEQLTSTWVVWDALGGLVVPAVAVAAVSFPTGRRSGAGRAVAGLATAVAVLAVVGRAVGYDPGGWRWCRCERNPLALLGPASYPTLDLILAVLSTVVAAVTLGLLLLRRPGRRLSLAFTGAFAVLLLGLVLGLVSTTSAAASVTALGLILVPALYVLGHLAQRPSRAHVADLLLAAREEEYDPQRLRALVGRAIGDPSAVVGWWDPARAEFLDHQDRVVPTRNHGVLHAETAAGPVTLVVSESIDTIDPSVRDAVAQALLLAAENRRLTRELVASLEQVRDSRARIVDAGDEARRRIERDLHDGAQQLLVSTGIKLNLVAARSDPVTAQLIGDASAELTKALAELRSLASGIAPTSLVHGTLANAVRELALRSPVTTAVHVEGDAEPDEQVAATVYFVVAECLANAAKHADARTATVELGLGDPVRVSVRDDGHGGASLVGPGSGLRGLVDRVEARGGRLDLVSGSAGTVVTASIPAAPA